MDIATQLQTIRFYAQQAYNAGNTAQYNALLQQEAGLIQSMQQGYPQQQAYMQPQQGYPQPQQPQRPQQGYAPPVQYSPPQPPGGISQQERDTEITLLRTQLDRLNEELGSLRRQVGSVVGEQALMRGESKGRGPSEIISAKALRDAWPSQQVAGVIEYKDLQPRPYYYGMTELLNDQSQPFGFTGNPITLSINLDTDIHYLKGLDFFQYCQQRPIDDTETPLFRWLPASPGRRAYVIPAGARVPGLDFSFNVKTRNGLLLSQGELPNAILDRWDAQGWEFPAEYNAAPDETITITVTPLGDQPAPDGYVFRTFVALFGYHMAILKSSPILQAG